MDSLLSVTRNTVVSLVFPKFAPHGVLLLVAAFTPLAVLPKLLAEEKGSVAALKDELPRVAEDAAPEAVAERDLKELQGRWFYEFANQAGAKMRVEKQVDGTVDTVTQFDAQANIIHAHRSTFELKRHGPLRVFTILNSVATAGPQMGVQRQGNRSYVYRIEGDRMIEAWGLLEGDRGLPNVIVWKRIPAVP